MTTTILKPPCQATLSQFRRWSEQGPRYNKICMRVLTRFGYQTSSQVPTEETMTTINRAIREEFAERNML